jgi:hypothetical protein
MVTYSGSFAGRVVCRPEVDVPNKQTVMISVEQHDHVLASLLVTNITQQGVMFDLKFDYHTLVDSVRLIITTQIQDRQFNKDYPVAVESLVLDDIFTIPHLLHSATVIVDNTVLDTGNVLWCSGQLVYAFKLPLISVVGIE